MEAPLNNDELSQIREFLQEKKLGGSTLEIASQRPPDARFLGRVGRWTLWRLIRKVSRVLLILSIPITASRVCEEYGPVALKAAEVVADALIERPHDDGFNGRIEKPDLYAMSTASTSTPVHYTYPAATVPLTEPILNFSNVDIPDGTRLEALTIYGYNMVVAYTDKGTGKRVRLFSADEAERLMASYLRSQGKLP